MCATADWFARERHLARGAPAAIRYSMIAKAFELPIADLREIVIASCDWQIFLGFDQSPAAATARPRHPWAPPPGAAIYTIFHPYSAALK